MSKTIKEFYEAAKAYGNKPKEFIIATCAFAAEMGRFATEGTHNSDDDTYTLDGMKVSGELLKDVQAMFNVSTLGSPLYTEASFVPNDDGFEFTLLMDGVLQREHTEMYKGIRLNWKCVKSIEKGTLIFTKWNPDLKEPF